MTIDEIIEKYSEEDKTDFYSISRDRLLNARIAGFVKDMALLHSTGLGFAVPTGVDLDYAAIDWEIASQEQIENYREKMRLGMKRLDAFLQR